MIWNARSRLSSYRSVARLSNGRPLTWQHPELWVMGVSVAAWIALASVHGTGWNDMGMRPSMPMSPPLDQGLLTTWSSQLMSGTLMVVAMMPPLVIPQIRVTALRSLWARRQRAITCFLFGYLAVWLIAMAVAGLLLVLVDGHAWSNASIVGAVAFVAAGVWQVTPMKRIGLRGCHRTIPLAPTGWQADRDCVRYGYATARSCFLSCWLLMLACVFAQHDLLPMLGAGGVALGERLVFRPRQLVMAT
ncbi:MAG: DUF2182 domain-containing protein, partial [Chloroflexi bacterium]|nr:DUF2182 domain-containing protein [Chloroflexota bacterium]